MRLNLSLAKKGQPAAAYTRGREESLRDMLLEAFSQVKTQNRLLYPSPAPGIAKPGAAKD